MGIELSIVRPIGLVTAQLSMYSTLFQMCFNEIDSVVELVDEVNRIVKELGPFTDYFVHVGFPKPRESDAE